MLLLNAGCATNMVENMAKGTPSSPDKILKVEHAYKQDNTLIVCVAAKHDSATEIQRYAFELQTDLLAQSYNQLDQTPKNFEIQGINSIYFFRHGLKKCPSDKEAEMLEKVNIVKVDKLPDLAPKEKEAIYTSVVKKFTPKSTSIDTDSYITDLGSYGISVMYYSNIAKFHSPYSLHGVYLNSEPPHYGGVKAAYLLLPFAAIFDVITAPAQFLYLIIYMGGQ